MTYAEVETQVKQLSHADKLLLLRAITRWLLEESGGQISFRSVQTPHKPKRPPAPASDLRGIARPDGSLPTDDELKQDYIDHLDRKYA